VPPPSTAPPGGEPARPPENLREAEGGSGSDGPGSAAGAPAVVRQLQALGALRREGALSAEEYAAAKRAVLHLGCEPVGSLKLERQRPGPSPTCGGPPPTGLG